MTTNPILSFILLNFNNSQYTVPCIQSIQKFVKIPYEIIVVDNGSTDRSLDVLSRIDGIVLVKNSTNRGFTCGNNDGVKAACGEYVVILNNDTVIEDSNLNKVPEIFKLLGRSDVIGGKMVGMDGVVQTSGGFEPQPIHLLLQFILYCYKWIQLPWIKQIWFLDWGNKAVQEVDWAAGCFFIMRRSVYVELGGFDEAIFIYLDEVDLHKRVRKLGGKIYLHAELVVRHYGSVTWIGKRYVGVRHNYQSAVYYLGKYYGSFQKNFFIFFVKLANLIYFPIIALLSILFLRKSELINEKLKICKVLLLT
jgi:GT2 family glycosyltransferase